MSENEKKTRTELGTVGKIVLDEAELKEVLGGMSGWCTGPTLMYFLPQAEPKR